MRLVLRVLKALLRNVRGRALALLLAFFLLYRIRVSKGLNFPDGLFSRIFDHNIYQRCAASPQDIAEQNIPEAVNFFTKKRDCAIICLIVRLHNEERR